MTRLGADVDQLDQLARSFGDAAKRIEHNANVIEWQLRSLWWSGSTADRFTASWASTDRKRLSVVAVALDDLGAKLRRQAIQQRRASESGGGGAYGISLGNWGTMTSPVHHGSNLEMMLESILLGVDASAERFGLLGTGVGRFLGGLSILASGVDLLVGRRDDGLAWIESGADLLSIGGTATLLLFGASNPIGWAVLGAAYVTDFGLWVHDNWEAVTDFAGDVGDVVVDAATFLVSPAVEAVETVVDVTEKVVDVVGDGVEMIGDGIEAVGSVVSGAGRLIGGWFS